MKAPVKLEMTNCDFSDIGIMNIEEEGVVEYIRKDYLLEWAKKDIEEIKKFADSGDAMSIGYLFGTRELIDKLNVM